MADTKDKSIEQFNNNEYNHSTFPERPSLDITFNDLTYTVDSLRSGRKEILHGISGEFRSGELTAIMGPSGAGKSTLLNLLAGFAVKGSNGEICVNGLNRKASQLKHFQKLSCFIQQDDELRLLLTAREAMSFATHLKFGTGKSKFEKEKHITYLLELLGLSEHENTRTKMLSGGQRKRLSIALELITSPPLLFLDEPTTGLDSSSTSACISLLKNLSRQGHTVICTIHQPSALIFEMMDHLYSLADGRCIYQGSVHELLPYLNSFGLVCPPYHNPADFLIEVCVGEYSADLTTLANAAAKKGRQDSIPYVEEIAKEENGISMKVLKSKKSSVNFIDYSNSLPSPAPLWFQLFYLFSRNCLIQRRDIFNLLLRIAMHLIISVVFGIIYKNVGDSANSVFGNYIYVYGTNLFLHYTGQMAVTLSFPLEYKVLRREYLNRWYTLTPYCLSIGLFEIPFQILCVVIYLVPSYLLTAQPMEWSRFLLFFLFLVSVCLTAQAYGFLVGATTPVTLAVFIGPVITVFLSVFGFATKYNDIPYLLKIFYQISYFRVSFQGCLLTLYGFNRSNLPCYLDGFHGHLGYCQYRHPLKFLREMEFREIEPIFDISYILSVGILAYICTVTAVWYRLTKR